MNIKLLITGTVLAAGLVYGAGQVLAYRGNPTITGPNYSEERHEAMTQAFANNDYEAWSNLYQGRGRVAQVVNEANFAQFAEAHRLMLEGDTEAANQIRTELGLGTGSQMRMGRGGFSQ